MLEIMITLASRLRGAACRSGRSETTEKNTLVTLVLYVSRQSAISSLQRFSFIFRASLVSGYPLGPETPAAAMTRERYFSRDSRSEVNFCRSSLEVTSQGPRGMISPLRCGEDDD